MTDQPQFTPGPWEADNNDGYSINRVFAKVRGHYAIAEVIGDSAETEANARLIAAAPDMFEALELAEAAMNYMGDILNNMDAVLPEDELATDAAFKAVDSALAKARGQS